MKRSLLLLLLVLVACLDPVHADAVNALGPEAAGVRPGPDHRPGQPCLVCHGGQGPGAPEMAIGGTVFDVRDSKTGLAGVDVVITDATGAKQTLRSNEVGNFYVFVAEWQPAFPLHVTVGQGSITKAMTSRIGRDGSCNACHGGPDTNTSMPGVFLKDVK